eukprot:CAMPEP_0178402572 /NCGR_PEP_ID=MMETSP0689_2-20121128/16912_1 /TAXON_ID=160604 /ORGANISM="Amphidinium massartii, Strain CS-259" /LENGTH=1582 /DNA_ID=CAMNT_0020023479 /DNA_START=98 /DNA_END=4843 /DNA_ORIENTATION=+
MEARMFAQILDLRSQSSQGPSNRKLSNNALLLAKAQHDAVARVSGGGSMEARTSGSPASSVSAPATMSKRDSGTASRATMTGTRSAKPTMSDRVAFSPGERSANSSADMSASTPALLIDAGTGGTRPSPKGAVRPTLSMPSRTNSINAPATRTNSMLATPSQSPKTNGRQPKAASPSAARSPSSKSPMRPMESSPSVSGTRSASYPVAAGSIDSLCVLLGTQLASWTHVETAARQLFSTSQDGEDGKSLCSRSGELYLQQLIADMSHQSERLQLVFEKFLESRKPSTRGRPQLADQEAFLRKECDRLIEEKAEMSRLMATYQAEIEKKTKDEALLVESNKEELSKHTAKFQQECERLEKERVEMVRSMSEFRAASERRIEQESAEMARHIETLHSESERKLAEATEEANRRLAESRALTEEKLQKERQVTNDIMHVLHELPPLQAAMELGDIRLLDDELQKWRADILPERFGDCKYVVEAVVKLARERLLTWRNVERMWKDVMKEVEHIPTDLNALTTQSQRMFRVLKESQLTKIDLRRSDPQALDHICDILLAWQEKAMLHPNDVQALMIRRVVTWPHLGAFDFADLDICLRLVDKEGCPSFLSRARSLVERETVAPQDLKPLLSHIETMLFFLKYTGREDLKLTYREFQKQSGELNSTVAAYLKWAEQEYPSGSELVRLPANKDLMDDCNVTTVLQELRDGRHHRRQGIRPFLEIFYRWALAMHKAFNLLVLPHHTQVVCLLMFRKFLESQPPPKTLIAQVGTGEGKSMIIAALAVYAAVTLRKKVHVVVDDETLLERDFDSFKSLFDAFQVTDEYGQKQTLRSVLCVSEERLEARGGSPCAVTRIDPEADICYCEAKHVQSFYASIARGEKRDFSNYEDRILILDEVDALVIDEEPNDAFVYKNAALSKLATTLAGALSQGSPIDAHIQNSPHPAAARVGSEMLKEWAHGKQLQAGEDFVFVKETGRYCALQAGRANVKSWSLALECRNYQDGLTHEILFQERLFVASRPRVFRKYYRILGLSGSIGSKPEQTFLRDTYGAAFFKVPPFLKTCRGSPFHEPLPVKLGQKRQAVYVENTGEAQFARLTEVVFEARERVPVLVIARDRGVADSLVEALQHEAKLRGFGTTLGQDMIRSLSRGLYEVDPEQWKENLNRATLALGDGRSSGKSWRITVTDRRGGRGTDYRVDDSSVDAQGGLLLVPTILPHSRREWTQFLGRTARQDCKGQFCCILNAQDLAELRQKNKESLPTNGDLNAIEMVLTWGDREAKERIQGSAALYNTGLRVNELSEEIFSHRHDILESPLAREMVVDVCQRFRWMSVREVDEAFAQLPDFDPTAVPTEAHDLGRPSNAGAVATNEPNKKALMRSVKPEGRVRTQPKVVIFCLDCSASMLSKDTRTPMSRFDLCLARVKRIMTEQVRDEDLVGLIVFGPDVSTVFPPTAKGLGGAALEAKLGALRPQLIGGTKFFDAVAQSLMSLSQSVPEARHWLICLTDGDDLGSQIGNTRGEQVNELLSSGAVHDLNMVVITVGALQAANVEIVSSWAERVSAAGGIGRHLLEKDAGRISEAFDVVAECLAAE